MKGKISVFVQNRHITFKFDLERNITILTGDSGTGKTKLINMVRMYASEGKASGVTLKCSCPCMVLEGNNWDTVLNNTKGSVVFVEESTKFLKSEAFAREIKNTDNYYVLVTREKLPQIPYSIDSIKKIVKKERKPSIEKEYKNISVKHISSFPYDEVIVEDSKSGFVFFSKACEKWSVHCISSDGKSSILSELKKCKADRILVIADAAALGSEIMELMRFKEHSERKIDFFLPECFEWLALKSVIFIGNDNVKHILENPIEYIGSKEYFSWERFFAHLLTAETQNREKLRYRKDKATLPSGYLTEANMESILKAME